jgi:hypothetical protein
MKKTLAALLIVGLAACGDEAPPRPAAKAPEAPPVAKPAPPPPPPVAKAEEPKPDPNKELADRVKRALTDDAKIQAAGIDVTAQNGTVTLWGTAATQSERNRAGAAAAKVQGVNSVDNRLAIVKGS